MIDTVNVTFPVKLDDRLLNGWISYPTIYPDGHRKQKYKQSGRVDNNATLSCLYYPPNPPWFSEPRLSLEVSLPKVLFGTNVQALGTPSQVEDAIERLNRFIARTLWLPDVDFGVGVLWRIDPTYDHQVGPYVQDYIRNLFKLDYPHRKTMPYPHEGVQFKSKNETLKFYDKARESRMPEAFGRLRQEITVRGTSKLEHQIGVIEPTLRDVTFPWLAEALQTGLHKLNLDSCTLLDRSAAKETLVNKYGWSRASVLYGHLLSRQGMNTGQIIASGANARTIRYYNQLITEAGISLALLDDGMCLPPLHINFGNGNPLPEVPSDT